jgi:hypothetical protein
MIAQTQTMADGVAATLKKAGKKAAASLTAELDSIKAAVKAAEESLKADNLLPAKEKAMVAQEKAIALVKDVEKLMPTKKAKTAQKKK